MFVRRWLAALGLGLGLVCGIPGLADDASTIPPRDAIIRSLPDQHLLEPWWSSPVIYRDSTLPMQLEPNGPITGRLAFPAAELIAVKDASGARTYEIGKDVTLAADGRTLTFGAASKVPYLTSADLYPPAGAPNSYKHRVGHPEQNLLFWQGHWFHDRQVEITYRRKSTEWPAAVSQFAEQTLPNTLARLRAKEPVTIGVSGDSITQGYNATGFTDGEPHTAPYPDLVAAQLQATYGAPVALKNRAIAGWSIAHGLKDLDNLLSEKPHLIIVAYGMNDVGRRDPEWFRSQVEEFLKRVRAADPAIEVILVASMTGNREWIHTPNEMFPKYRDALQSLTGPGVALADLTSVWMLLDQSKLHLDLTGNGLNHPNDTGHRLYAQSILGLLVPPAK